MKIVETGLPGVLVLEPRVFGDARGWFMETFNAAVFRDLGLPTEWAQDNQSFSTHGVVRGLHYQLHEPQGKLVRCNRGRILDVAVDIRQSSPHFGRSVSIELSSENRRMLWIPPKFAHGFAVLSDEAEVIYKCTTLWHQPSDRSIRFDDPTLAIDWGVPSPSLSTKDAAAPLLTNAEVFSS